MTETGWIIVILVAVVAIILVFVLLRRNGVAEALSQTPMAEDMVPEQLALPAGPEAEPVPGTSFPQEPLASIVPPVADSTAIDAAAPAKAAVDATPQHTAAAHAVPVDMPRSANPVSVAPATVAVPETPPVSGLAPKPADLSPRPTESVEPVTVSTPPVPAQAAIVPPSDGDNLLRLKGVGPKIVTLLHAQGITRYAQIAAWTEVDLAAIDAKLGNFAGRPKRDNWVDQARLLAAGDVAGYEAKYGKL